MLIVHKTAKTEQKKNTRSGRQANLEQHPVFYFVAHLSSTSAYFDRVAALIE